MASALVVGVLLCGVWLGPHVSKAYKTCKVCPSGWAVFDGRCYLFNMQEKEWIDAELTCTSLGANLASLRDIRVLKFITDMIYTATGSSKKTWVGGHDAEGLWLWSDGSHFAFKDWAKGEPNNENGKEHCMEMNFKGKLHSKQNENFIIYKLLHIDAISSNMFPNIMFNFLLQESMSMMRSAQRRTLMFVPKT
uniref:C-type lectin domain-containing protein n=1 Tax=Sphaeramia orbicularis TaxID=375764 RepID=A0A673BUW4_9TELE